MNPDSQQLLTALGRHNLLLPLIRAEMIAEAVKDVTLAEEEASVALQTFREANGISDEGGMQAYLESRGLQAEQLMWQILLPLRIKGYSMETFGHRAENRFLERKRSLDRVVYSILRTSAQGLAHEYYHRLLENEADFPEIVAELKNGPEQYSRGIVGPVSLIKAHPQFAERLRITPAGDLIAPFQIDRWWIVARVEHKIPATLTNEMKETMCRELFEVWISEQVKGKFEASRSSAAAQV